MRLIALLGALFVLASCSDSDTPENFGLSCYKEHEIDYYTKFLHIFEFDFDKNKVIRIDGDLEFEHFISEISTARIVFKQVTFGKLDIDYVLDRANLTIEQSIIWPNSTITNIFNCELPQV